MRELAKASDMRVLLLLCELALLAAAPHGEQQLELLSPGETRNGRCSNEASFAYGNHCVKLTGSTLTRFEAGTDQSFLNPDGTRATEWCCCLHLYTCWGQGGGDTSACSRAALADAAGITCAEDLKELAKAAPP